MQRHDSRNVTRIHRVVVETLTHHFLIFIMHVFRKNLLFSHYFFYRLSQRERDRRFNLKYLRDRLVYSTNAMYRRAHNPKVVGSNPAPATRFKKKLTFIVSFFFVKIETACCLCRHL